MEAVGQLTSGLAHDFSNLLTSISGSLELLQVRISQGRIVDLGRYVTAAQTAAARATAITHRLLAFSRRQMFDPRPVDMNHLVGEMGELIRRTVGPAIAVDTVLAAGLWPVLCDRNQLENALLNLCINARDAMPNGGKLAIGTANIWLDERCARGWDMAPGQYVALSVTDTGTGMTPEVTARAFEPFFTTKAAGTGTGLGLSMIYGFARQSGGQAQIYSQHGHGTIIRLYLPRYCGEDYSEMSRTELTEAPRAVAGETVLIVEDEPTIRMLVTEALDDLGYTAIQAEDGAGGLQVLQSDTRLDLLIADLGLPGGMNGWQVADAGRAARPDLKVLFITGYAESAVLNQNRLEPGMYVLIKPFAMEALANRIKDIISDPSPGE
jgi:CheY-like chemotaxis protein